MKVDLQRLNTLVAEEILGLVACPAWEQGPGLGQWSKNCDHADGTCYPLGFPAKYSTVANKKIIESIMAEPHTSIQINGTENKMWRVRITWSVEDAPKSVMMESDSMEVAVCLAALDMQSVDLRSLV